MSVAEPVTEVGPFAALAHRFSIRCEAPDVAEWLARTLTTLRTSPADGTSGWYDIDSAADGRGTLRWGGSIVRANQSMPMVAAVLMWHVNQQAVASVRPDHVVLHAGAVAGRDGALLLPAPMEAGKTTLVAGLVDRGWTYLTDEAAAVPLYDITVRPYPKPLSIDPGSQALLAHWQPSAPWTGWDRGPRQWQVPVTAVGGTVAEPAPPTAIAFPRYEAGAATRLEPLSPAHALAELATCAFAWTGPGLRQRFTTLEGLVRCASAARLVVGDLQAACDLLEGWVERRSTAPAGAGR